MLFVAVFLFVVQILRIDSIFCSQCSYFPEELKYLAEKLVADTSDLSTLSETQRLTALQVENAMRYNYTRCLQYPKEYKFECTNPLDTCVIQMIEWIEVAKYPAVLYTCSKLSKSGCVSDEDGDLKWTMCACQNKDDCSKIELKPGYLYTSHLNSTELPDDEMDDKSQKIISAVIVLLIACIKCSIGKDNDLEKHIGYDQERGMEEDIIEEKRTFYIWRYTQKTNIVRAV
ncbi:hypothetical protein M3Y96_00283200 [Aphelenchoides besseyi]|nr:hypothetical protein M3Y96_00283200 [Aphelenchoides besseyi]